MPRPKKPRSVGGVPPVTVYKPLGIPARDLEWVRLTLDEFESLRLIDHVGLEQAVVAERMGVSRPTVSRIAASARAKVARALALGQALAIEGGCVVPDVPRRGRQGRYRGGRGHGHGGFRE